MPDRKLMSASEAVDRFVSDGDTIYFGYTSVAMGLALEVVRQKRRRLEIVGGSVGIQGNILMLAGCVDRVRTGYIGGALRPGRITEMMDSGEIRFEDYSNQAIALMLMAGALGIPFIPTRSFLGSDYLDPRYANPPGGFLGDKKWAEMESPFDREKVVLLPALRPDVTILPAQRADQFGNIQAWGHQGDARWGYWASEKVIVSVEEIVPSEVVRADPSRTIVPGFRVSAVVHMPFGAHPSSMGGYYDNDYAYMASVLAGIGASPERFDAFLAEWVEGCPSRESYLSHYREVFGEEALDRIRATAGSDAGGGVRYTYSRHQSFG